MSDNNYNHKVVEKDLYKIWKNNRLFEPQKKQPNQKNFSIILPPPNVTGKLHLGHAWDGALQDCLIRYKKMNGYRTAWIPGTDHAGISTQTKFENILKEQNIDPKSMPLDQFKKELKEWSLSQAENIRSQWAMMGFSLAYGGETFTLDKNVNDLVVKTFVELYKNKLIYQDYKLVNWDVKLKTAISDIEVIKKPTKSKMYYFKYYLADDKNVFLPVATTRPETMFGDTNIFINPKDKRYSKYINRYTINPINNEKIKIMADEYVDPKFGTGVMKCTPAHDFNDYQLAKKYKIKNYFSIMNDDGTLNEKAKSSEFNYIGIDRLVARKMIVQELQKKELLISVEEHQNDIGYSERTNEIVEPLLSKQWFVKMKDMASDIIKIQKGKSQDKCTFYPKRMNNALIKWLENIQDWCISRQLVWGHQIPVWYENGTNKIYVGEKSPGKNWEQEKAVLDTWFSSGLWPIATTLFNKNKDFKDFFPIDVLVTAYDILFFWVARMLFQCKTNSNVIPIKNVLIHGLIRDEQNRKMSKSLNNGIDPVDVIEEYGADALRLFLIGSSTMGDDLRFSKEKVLYYWSFLNKVWNAKNLIETHVVNPELVPVEHEINKWILAQLSKTIKKSNSHIENFNFALYSKKIIDFTWNEFCNKYLEHSKPLVKDAGYSDETKQTTLFVFKSILRMLHPICPFITDLIYGDLFDDDSWLVQQSNLPTVAPKCNVNDAEICMLIIEAVKTIRINNGIKKAQLIRIRVCSETDLPQWSRSLLNLHNIVCVSEQFKKFETIKTEIAIFEWENSDYSKITLEKLEKEKADLKIEVERSHTILLNKKFIKFAPKEKVALEKEKLLKYENQLSIIEQTIKTLNSK